MVDCIKIPLKEAETIKKELLGKNEIDINFNPLKEDGFIFFPVINYSGDLKIFQKELTPRKERLSAVPFKEVLRTVLSEDEMRLVKTAYEVVGSIAIIEVPDELVSKERLIAETLLSSNKMIKTVVKKKGGHEGVFRTQKMVVLAGENTKVASYKENNCIIKYDLENVYFSARLSSERKRILQLIRPGEDVLVMFSGAAPYPVVFAKNSKAHEIVGVEINPKGHEFGLENVRINKLSNVELFCGDVREIVPSLGRSFDRIVMPLPKTAEEFLDVALPVAKKGCVIHMYAFYHVDNFQKALDEIESYCKSQNRIYEVLGIHKVGQHAPRIYRICVDFKLLN